MSAWFHWLDSLASQGGLILLTFVLFCAGCVMMFFKWPYGETVAHDSFIALMTASGAKALQTRQGVPPSGSPGVGTG